MKRCLLFHKWVDVVEEREEEFLGEKIITKHTIYKICDKCGIAKKIYYYYYSGDIFEEYLPPEKAEILKRKVEKVGDVYILRLEKKKDKK